MKVLLIYNPNSGNRTFKNYLDTILYKFQEKGYLVTLWRIAECCDLPALFQKIDRTEYKKVLIAGGDGTIHQVVNTLLDNGFDLPIGIYPAGTANDFAHNFGLPSGIEEMTEIYTRDNFVYSDVGMANGEYFINVASLGCLTDISQRTDPKVKTSFGIFSYYLKGIEEFQKIRTIKVRVESEDCTFDGEIYFMLVMNGKSAGGFKKVSPRSEISDGLLEVVIFKKCPVLELMNVLTKILRGVHTKNPNVLYFRAARLTVDCEDETGTDLDGERGVPFPLKIEVVPGRLKIMC
jgi:YegS/Rv2252/BmrU family lipid kinase